MKKYLEERKETYHKRFIKIGKYIALLMQSKYTDLVQVQKALIIGEECKQRYYDFEKLYIDYTAY